MRFGVLVIAGGAAAALSAACFGACLSASPPPSGGTAPHGSAPAASAPDGGLAVVSPPAHGEPAPPHSGTMMATAASAQPVDASAPTAAATPSPECTSPSVALSGPPRDGVVFNNAMTSADAGYVDRTALVLEALAAESKRLRCCLEPWANADSPSKAALMLVLELAPDGTVERALLDAMRSTPMPTGVDACVESVLRGRRFPKSPVDRRTIVEYPLELSKTAGEPPDGT